MNRIGVFTSGGDAPGMNACIRAVVRSASARGWTVVGIRRGFTGMLNGEMSDIGPRDMSNIIQRGGTILGTSRCEEFETPEGRSRAIRNLRAAGVEGLVAIGGDGTFHGAHAIGQEHHIPVIGVPGTIDNDVYGCDYTIGYDTAINTALDAIDKLRDTAASHSRIFFVEVMGRRAGFIALDTAIAGGAEEVLIPEEPCEMRAVADRLLEGIARGKSSSIVVVAEGEDAGGAGELARILEQQCAFDVRRTVLGHIQRGGSPTARDRVLASRLGAAAVKALADGLSGVMVGEIAGNVTLTPLPDTWTRKKPVRLADIDLARILAT